MIIVEEKHMYKDNQTNVLDYCSLLCFHFSTYHFLFLLKWYSPWKWSQKKRHLVWTHIWIDILNPGKILIWPTFRLTLCCSFWHKSKGEAFGMLTLNGQHFQPKCFHPCILRGAEQICSDTGLMGQVQPRLWCDWLNLCLQLELSLQTMRTK